MEMTHDMPVKNIDFHGITSAPPKIGVDPSGLPKKSANEVAQSLNSGISGPQGVSQILANQIEMNANPFMVHENQIRPPIENGSTTLFVGELYWWTTDAKIGSACSQYERVKEIKFFDERANGQAKGYCQVEFYDPAVAAACKEGMTGHVFNEWACVVAFVSPQTLMQMGAAYMNKTEGQAQSQSQGRRLNDGLGRDGNLNSQSGDTWGWRTGKGVFGAKNMVGGSARVGNGASGMGGYGQGPADPMFGGPPGGMMGAGFDPLYLGRGGGYGAFLDPGFPSVLPSFPAVNTMGLAGVAPHVNPTFFGQGVALNGIGMMGSSGMDGPHRGM
ncbi:hypothetical protein SLEP1_g50818 [Rubroshorea leprosula]|uniref:RRM domain-containing protein n=1 Tax=Rubroshorea leprosula TaxID=152421 RepID=A0AAV5M4F7_9ROSI|nr:hypothetical protein SLEP1_g50818 [Rubroshorea leprosula]